MVKIQLVSAALLIFGASIASRGSEPDRTSSKDKETECTHAELTGARETAKNKWKGGVLKRGRTITGGPTVTLAALIKSPEASNGKELVVEGSVRRACERRGCWMELAESKTGPAVRITFKDYGFFVPIDSAGARAKVSGKLKVVSLSQDLATHYESEGANVPRDSNGKAREIQIVADGVELRR